MSLAFIIRSNKTDKTGLLNNSRSHGNPYKRNCDKKGELDWVVLLKFFLLSLNSITYIPIFNGKSKLKKMYSSSFFMIFGRLCELKIKLAIIILR